MDDLNYTTKCLVEVVESKYHSWAAVLVLGGLLDRSMVLIASYFMMNYMIY